MKTNEEKLNPKVFELAAQLLYVNYGNDGNRYRFRGCCIAIKKAYIQIYGENDNYFNVAGRETHKDYFRKYFKPEFGSMPYWWKPGDKYPRHIALILCAEILKDENKTRS